MFLCRLCARARAARPSHYKTWDGGYGDEEEKKSEASFVGPRPFLRALAVLGRLNKLKNRRPVLYLLGPRVRVAQSMNL